MGSHPEAFSGGARSLWPSWAKADPDTAHKYLKESLISIECGFGRRPPTMGDAGMLRMEENRSRSTSQRLQSTEKYRDDNNFNGSMDRVRLFSRP